MSLSLLIGGFVRRHWPAYAAAGAMLAAIAAPRAPLAESATRTDPIEIDGGPQHRRERVRRLSGQDDAA